VIPLVANVVDHRRVLLYLNPIPNPLALMRSARTTWSLMRRPVKSREFPAELERLVTAAELMQYGFWSSAESA
jgi:hypothetical protein